MVKYQAYMWDYLFTCQSWWRWLLKVSNHKNSLGTEPLILEDPSLHLLDGVFSVLQDEQGFEDEGCLQNKIGRHSMNGSSHDYNKRYNFSTDLAIIQAMILDKSHHASKIIPN